MDIVHSMQLFSRKSAEHKNHLRFFENCNDNVPGFIKMKMNFRVFLLRLTSTSISLYLIVYDTHGCFQRKLIILGILMYGRNRNVHAIWILNYVFCLATVVSCKNVTSNNGLVQMRSTQKWVTSADKHHTIFWANKTTARDTACIPDFPGKFVTTRLAT